MPGATKVLNFCGVMIGKDTTGTDARMSSIEANWNTGFQLWDDGQNKWVFWGDVNGEIQLFDLELSAAAASELTTVVANWSSAETITVYQGGLGGAGLHPDHHKTVIAFTNMCYNMDVESKRLRPFGDKYVIEGASRFQIWS